MNTTSVTLLERLRGPDREAWNCFVLLYTPLLHRWACRFGLQAPDAEDLLQEVFQLLLREMPDFDYDRHKSFRAWLWTVLRHTHLNRLRHRPAMPLGADAELLPDPGRGETDEMAEAEYREYVLRQALQLLRAEFGPVTVRGFWECKVAGRPAREVADEVGMSLAALYASNCRVLAWLRQHLAGVVE